MKKSLIAILLSTFLLSTPVPCEASNDLPREEMQANSLPIQAATAASLQSIGIGRRRAVRRRRVRRVVRRRLRRANRGMHLRRGAYMRRSIRGRRHPRAMGLGVPRRLGLGVRRRGR